MSDLARMIEDLKKSEGLAPETLALIQAAADVQRNAKLQSLVEDWKQRSRAAFTAAEKETDEKGRWLLEHGAMCYFNAATELEAVINPGQPETDFTTRLRQEVALLNLRREAVIPMTPTLDSLTQRAEESLRVLWPSRPSAP